MYRATITVDDYARIASDLADRLRIYDDVILTPLDARSRGRIDRGRMPAFTFEGVSIYIDDVTTNLPPALAAMVARWLN